MHRCGRKIFAFVQLHQLKQIVYEILAKIVFDECFGPHRLYTTKQKLGSILMQTEPNMGHSWNSPGKYFRGDMTSHMFISLHELFTLRNFMNNQNTL